ncbi:MAG: tyrosine-protein phosphatase [Candidatus Thiodiazotropha sp.]
MLLRWILLLALLSPLSALADARVRPSEWAQPMLGIELDNFYRLNKEVYRSKQPDDELMAELEKMGIRSILNLRQYHSDEDEARDTHLKLYHVPVNAGDIDDAFVVTALRAIAEAEKPILIHCWHGSDRTGVVSAMYRLVFQDWPRERAIDEFINGGYGYHASFYPNIEQYLKQVDVDAIRRQVERQGGQKLTRN